MKVEIHNNLQDARVVEATRVIIYDRFDNPISIALEHIPDVIFAATAEHSDFNEILKNFGLNKTVICQNENIPELET